MEVKNMVLSVAEKIKIIADRRGITLTQLAEKLDTTRQNFSNKLNRNNFTEKDIKKIAEALSCNCEITFSFKDTGEQL